MFKPVQFSSQYTYDVLYKSSPTSKYTELTDKQNLAGYLMSRALRPTGVSGVSVRDAVVGDEHRLMVDDQRGLDADIANQALRGSENLAAVRKGMMEDPALQLSNKTPAEVAAVLDDRFARAEYVLRKGGGIQPPEKTDHVQFFFVKGEGNQPVLDHVSIATNSERLVGLSQQPTPEQASATPEEGSTEETEAKPAATSALNPLAALQSAFAVPLAKISVALRTPQA